MNKNKTAVLLLFAWLVVYFFGMHDYVRYNYFHRVGYRNLIEKYAEENNLRPELVAAVIYTESRFQPRAKSDRGAVGLMQLLPETAEWIAQERGIALKSLTDPEENICIGTSYLSYLRNRFNSPVVVLAAYNAGQGHVEEWFSIGEWNEKNPEIDEIPFSETKEFVRKVLYYENVYSEQFEGVD